MPVSNQSLKAKADRGEICYICLEAKRLTIDEFQGMSCQQCRNNLAAMRMKYALGGGYVVTERYRRFMEAITESTDVEGIINFLARKNKW